MVDEGFEVFCRVGDGYGCAAWWMRSLRCSVGWVTGRGVLYGG